MHFSKRIRRKIIDDLVIALLICLAVFIIHSFANLSETISKLVTSRDQWKINDSISLFFVLALTLGIISAYKYFELIKEINKRTVIEKELRTSESRIKMLIDNTFNPVFVVNESGRYLDANAAGLRFLECSKEEILKKRVWDTCPPEKLKEQMSQHFPFMEPRIVETDYKVKGKIKTLLLNVVPVETEDGTLLYGVGHDITERKQMEEKLKYLALHDELTGLYNRTYFEQQLVWYEYKFTEPMGIILVDLDGLKLINDTRGHSFGDKILVSVAMFLKNNFKNRYDIARIGGDEFAVIVPNISKEDLEKLCLELKGSISEYNKRHEQTPISLSIGYGYRANRATSIYDTFKEADDNMYRTKLHRKQSNRNSITQTLVKALEARDFITEGHSERLEFLIVNIADGMKLPLNRLHDLRLLARFHDIGKVGISDLILFKETPLNKDEVLEMQRHCEIGYRIAESSTDLMPIAGWILKHHEWWNGKGYPLGLKEEEIPLECRILSIVDAYDAMTNDRPYRKALTHQEAIIELERCSGQQFDPNLVPIVVQVLNRLYSKRDVNIA